LAKSSYGRSTCECRVAFRGDPAAHVPDVTVHTEGFLYDDERGGGLALLGQRHERLHRAVGCFDRDRLVHPRISGVSSGRAGVRVHRVSASLLPGGLSL
jgi:hypothetical protein